MTGHGHASWVAPKLLRILFLLLVVIVIVVLRVISFLLCLFRLFGFLVVLLLLLCLLHFRQGLPLRGELIGLLLVIGDDDIVKNGTALHLPQVEANEAEVGILVNGIVVHVVRVGDLLDLPHTDVGGV